MATLNKWQRLWVVVSALWLIPVLLMAGVMISNGAFAVYAPPELEGWTTTCEFTMNGGDGPNVVEMPNVGNVQFPESFTEKEMEAAARRLSGTTTRGDSLIWDEVTANGKWDLWIPKGSDGKLVQCSDLGSSIAYMYNPKTQKAERPVFARLDSYGAFHRGYDMDSALRKDTMERIERSKWARVQNAAVLLGAGLGIPLFVYALGAAVAWIRRG
jgi:hypothetical protein